MGRRTVPGPCDNAGWKIPASLLTDAQGEDREAPSVANAVATLTGASSAVSLLT